MLQSGGINLHPDAQISPQAENKEQDCRLRILFFGVLFRRGSSAPRTG